MIKNTELLSKIGTNAPKSRAPTQLKILRLLCQKELFHFEIKDNLELKKNTISEVVSILRQKEYVKLKKELGPSDEKIDARYKKIGITPNGFNFLVENTNAFTEFFDILFDIFSSGQNHRLMIDVEKQIEGYDEKILKIKKDHLLNRQMIEIINQTYELIRSDDFKKDWHVLEYFGKHGKMSYDDPGSAYWDNPKTGTSHNFLNLLNDGLLTRYEKEKFGLSILGVFALIYHYSLQLSDARTIEIDRHNFARFRNDYEIEKDREKNSKVATNVKKIIHNYGDLLPKIFSHVNDSKSDFEYILKIIPPLIFQTKLIDVSDEVTQKILFSQQAKIRNNADKFDLEYANFRTSYDRWLARTKCNFPIFDKDRSFSKEFFGSFWICAIRDFEVAKIPKDTKLIKFDTEDFSFKWYVDPTQYEHVMNEFVNTDQSINDLENDEKLRKVEKEIRDKHGISLEEYQIKMEEEALSLENKINYSIISYLLNKFITNKINEKLIKNQFDELIKKCLGESFFVGIKNEIDNLKNMFNSLLELVKVKDVLMQGPHKFSTDFVKKYLDIKGIQNVISFQFFTCLRVIDHFRFDEFLKNKELREWYSNELQEINSFNLQYDKKYNDEIVNISRECLKIS